MTSPPTDSREEYSFPYVFLGRDGERHADEIVVLADSREDAEEAAHAEMLRRSSA